MFIFGLNDKYILRRRVAFTLAEVLITLGIIGIVAAMTIPTLVQSYQKHETIEQLKSVYATLNAAIDSAKVDYGTDVGSWNMPTDSTASASSYFAQNYLLPYLKTSKVCGTQTSTDCVFLKQYLDGQGYWELSGYSGYYTFTLLGGAIVQVCADELNAAGSTVNDGRVFLYFDLNGMKKPNVMGKDVFIVELAGPNKNKFLPYMISSDIPRDTLKSGDGNGCNKTNGNGWYCFALIVQDGWQIKDDYPW